MTRLWTPNRPSFCAAPYGALVGACRPKGQARGITYIINDTFDAWSGWTEIAGVWGVAAGEAYETTGVMGITYREAGIADGNLQCTVRGTLAAAGYYLPQIIFRCGDADNFLFGDLYNDTVRLVKRDAGSYSLLASAGMVVSDGTNYQLKVMLSGTAVSIYVDGVLQLSYTLAGGDTKYTAYTMVGMRVDINGAGHIFPARFDNFQVWAL